MNYETSSPRAYRQTARARAASLTAERILAAFQTRLIDGWFDEIRLDDIAADAGVTVQTVIRRFGGKDGLLDACHRRLSVEMVEARQLPVGDVCAAIDAIVRDYEAHGDFILRMLAQEDRYPAIRAFTDYGRADHRRWVGEVFEPWLRSLDATEREAAHDRLVIALDVYVWKLVRRDMKRSTEAVRDTMMNLCAAALHTDIEALKSRLVKRRDDA